MAENCPLPGETLPSVQIDGITIHPIAPNVPPGGDPGRQGVEIQVDLSVRQVLEDANESNWLQDETLVKYLNLRVIQVRRPEADRFIAGAIADLTRRNLIGKSLTFQDLGEAVFQQDELFYQGGFLEYAGQSYEHRTSDRGKRTPQFRRAKDKAANLIHMLSMDNYNPHLNAFYRILYPSPEEAENRENVFPWPEDKPSNVDFVTPGGFQGDDIEAFGNIMVGTMIYAPLGIKRAGLARSGYTRLGTGVEGVSGRLYFRDDNVYMQSDGIVTLYDAPLVDNQGNLSFANIETVTEGGSTEVQARLNSVHFGKPENRRMRDKTLTSKDIEFLRYHAFLYVDLNKLLADMEGEDD